MSEHIYLYDKNKQFDHTEVQQIFNIFTGLQTKGQIKTYVDNIETCIIRYGNLGEQKQVFVLKSKNLIVSFVSLSLGNCPSISFVGTHLDYQHRGFAKKIINELQLKYTSLCANVDSMFTTGIENLLRSCDFKKPKNGNIWKWNK